MKQILSEKKRLEEFETIALNEGYNAVLQRKLHSKLKDPGRFTIPCSIGSKFPCKALRHLGVSINLMPLSIYKKLELGEIGPIFFLDGEIENILVKVDKFIFPIDCVILDMEEDKDVPIIMRQSFLPTGRTLIDVATGELIIRVSNK